MIWFVFVISVSSGIMYGIRGNSPIAYIDCLFLTASAMTVTGLVTYPISQLTLAQQILLFILMTIGNLVINSVVMVLLRRHFFGKKFRHLVKKSASVRARMQDIEDQEEKQHQEEMKRMRHFFGLRSMENDSNPLSGEQMKHPRRAADKNKSNNSSKRPKLHAGMIQRMDEPARQVNPAGHMTTMVANADAPEFFHPVPSNNEEPAISSILQTSDGPEPFKESSNDSTTTGIRIMEPGQDGVTYPKFHPPDDSILSQDQGIIQSPKDDAGVKISEPLEKSENHTINSATSLKQSLANETVSKTDSGNSESIRMADFQTRHPSKGIPTRRRSLDQSDRPRPNEKMRRHHTVSFSDDPDREMAHSTQAPRRAMTTMSQDSFATRSLSIARTNTMQTDRGTAQRRRGTALHRTMTRNKDKGLGGFPTPLELGLGIIESLPFKNQLRVPRSATMASSRPGRSMTMDSDANRVRLAPYLTFDAEVRGNSHFHNLNHAQRNELGGVEYRAIDVLAWLIPSYWLFWALLSIIITTPYLMSGAGIQYRDALQQQDKPPHNAAWYWIFNTVSSLTNTGMSLADASYEGTLGKAYMLLIPSIVLILVGNTAYPVMLRFVIWVMSKCVGENSQLYETLQFLLDHPRRCFIYLFPRENTWFLFGLVVLLTLIDWFFIMVLDLDKRFEWPSIGVWVFDSFFQSIAVRSAGLQTFNILSLVPAEQMLQVFMMYLAVYPLTMAVRTTNVYEEGSLGVYEETESPEEDNDQGQAVWGRYLSEQVRRQVAFDLWWIALALWIVLIAEKRHIGDYINYPNISVFTVTYEMISAYGTVGLSCGSQDGTASLSRDFSVISKLIVIAVMIRGRHRGLPSAIDRAIMLPSELHAYDQTHDAHFSTSFNDEDPDAESSNPMEIRQDTRLGNSEQSQDPEDAPIPQDSAQSTGIQSTMSDNGMHRIWSRPRVSSVAKDLVPIDEISSGTPGISTSTPAQSSPEVSKPGSIHSL